MRSKTYALAQRQGDYTRAMALLEEALRLSRTQEDRAGIAYSFNVMVGVALEQSDYRRADEYFAVTSRAARKWR